MAGLSKSLVEVGISMVLRDGFSQQAGKISKSFNGMMNDMNQWNRAVSQSVGAAFDYGTKMVGGMYDAYQHSAKVTNQIFMTSKIAGATAEQAQRLLQITQEVNRQTPLTNLDIASGARYLAMAGNSADAIEKMIEPAAKLASIFDMQLGGKGGVADMMTNIMATFGIAAVDAKKTADILAVGTTSANINLTDLAQSLQYSGATFRNAGVDLKTAVAAIGVLGDQGIQASSAGTALANMLRYLTLSITGQKTKGTKMLAAMGIDREDLIDARGNLKSLGDLISIIGAKMARLSGTAREVAMYNIFGVRGQRAASSLFQALWNGSNKMQTMIDKESESEGFTDTTMAERLKTPEGRINAFNAAIDNLRVSMGNTLSVFSPLLTCVTSMANGIARISGEGGIGTWAIKLGACITIASTLVTGVRLLYGLWKMVTTTTALYQAQTTSANAAMAAANTGMAAMNTQATILETHLRTIVALMAEYVAMSYAPGTKGMMLPMGGRLGKNKAGRVYVGYNGKSISTATYANTYGAPITSAPKPPTPPTAPVSPSLRNRIGGAAALGFGLMGGPWGIGLSLGITGLMLALDYFGNKVDENTNALNNNTDKLSSEEMMNQYNEKYAEAIVAAIKETGRNSTVRLNINGQNYNNVRDGDTITLDDVGGFYV